MQQQGRTTRAVGLEHHGIANPRHQRPEMGQPTLVAPQRLFIQARSRQVPPARLLAYLEGKDLFVQDCYVEADPAYQLPLRVVTEKAWHVTEPQPNFSACFGEPFMAQDPVVYARLLGDKIAHHASQVWLVNTGWTGGPYGEGQRLDLGHTRAMVRAALTDALDKAALTADPVFGVMVPETVPEVPPEVLIPRNTWKDPAAYDAQAAKLAGMFSKNFERFRNTVTPEISQAGPRQN
jgi:ATP-dependent phosphoenolpyruvate carboxykinase